MTSEKGNFLIITWLISFFRLIHAEIPQVLLYWLWPLGAAGMATNLGVAWWNGGLWFKAWEGVKDPLRWLELNLWLKFRWINKFSFAGAGVNDHNLETSSTNQRDPSIGMGRIWVIPSWPSSVVSSSFHQPKYHQINSATSTAINNSSYA